MAKSTKTDTEFTTRLLMGMRTEFETLLESVAQLRVCFDTLAQEHGIAPIPSTPLVVKRRERKPR